MTIFKTQIKKEDKEEGGLVVTPQPLLKSHKEAGGGGGGRSPPPVGVILAARRRARLTNTCILLSVLMLVAIAVISGVYIYRHFFTGPRIATCGVTYEFTRQELQRSSYQRGYMEERVEIDRNGFYERIEVPDFDECNRAVVLHEFVKNLTAIVDHNAGHCFIMPLNRREVRPPKDFWDLISKLRSGYYMPDSRIVRHYYKVVKPAIANPTIFGPYIGNECFMLDTYRLKKRKRMEREHKRHRSEHFGRQKRSADNDEEAKSFTYGFFGGVTDERHTGLIVEFQIEP